MKTLYIWSLGFLLLVIIFSMKSSMIYEMFGSTPQVYYFWRSGDDISEKFNPQWNIIKERIVKNNLNIKICDVEISKEPDLATYEKSKKDYNDIPLVRLISSSGNRYDYGVVNNYKYYYNATVEELREYLRYGGAAGSRTGSDIGGFLASNKVYKMIVDNYNK